MTTTKQSWFKRSLAVLLAVMMVMSMGVANVFAAGTDEVSIPDASLKAAINQQLAKQTGSQREDDAAVTKDDMASLTELVAEDAGITDLTGLDKAVNLETLDLSGNELSMSSPFETLAFITGLTSLDLSNNHFTGKLLCALEMNSLEILDLSGNRINAIELGNVTFPNLEKIDLSDNYFYQDESTVGYDAMVRIGIEKFDLSNQKNLATLNGAWVKNPTKTVFNIYESTKVTEANGVIDVGDVFGNSVTLAFVGYSPDSTTKITVNGTIYTVVSTDKDTGRLDEGMTHITLSNLTSGENTILLSVMHMGGDTKSYTLKVNSVPLPTGTDSAGITDVMLHKAICDKLGEDYTTHIITKDDMKELTEKLTVTNVTSLEGLQYAVNLTGLSASGTFVDVPELSSSLKELELRSENCTELPASIGNNENLSSLTLYLPNVILLPDLTKTSLVDLTIGQISGVDNQLTELPVVPSTLTSFAALGCPYVTCLPESLGNCSGLTTISLSACSDITDMSALQNLPEGQVTMTLRSMEGSVLLAGMADENGTISSIKTLTINNCAGSEFDQNIQSLPNLERLEINNSKFVDLPEWVASSDKLTYVDLRYNALTDIPTALLNLSNLETLVLSYNSTLTDSDADLSGLTDLTELKMVSCGLTALPQNIGDLSNLTSLEVNQNKISVIGDELKGLTKLTTLDLSGNYLLEIPESLSVLTSLQSLKFTTNPYITVPYAPFENLSALKSLSIGGALKLDVLQAGGSMYVDNQTADTIAKLTERGVSVSPGFGYASALKSLEVAGYGEVSDILYPVANQVNNPPTFYIEVDDETESLELIPTALFEDTTITVNGTEVKSGESITIENLQKGANTVTVSTENKYAQVMLMEDAIDYNLTVMVGEYSIDDFPTEGRYYEIPVSALKSANDSLSMTNSYIEPNVVVSYKDGQYRIDFTTIRQDYIPSLKYRDAEGSYVDADELSRDVGENTATWRMYTDTLEEDLYISPYVVPMGYSPVCRLQFDLTKIVDITDTMPTIDKAALNIAINAAVAITEKRNVYTDASWKNFMEKLEAAQTIAENDIATQDAVNTAAKELETAMTVGGEGGLVIDESKLANKTALKTAINEAKALQQGNHTATAWNALQEAITDAQAVYDTLEASQTEVDTAAKSLNTAVTLFQNSGEASELDRFNLEDGVYSVYGEMIKTDREEKSMSNDAINHYIKLTVEDGKYYLNMDFHGLAYLNKFGYLAELSYYDNGYIYGQYGTVEGTLIPATVLSTQKNADGSDLYDEFNQAGGSYEGKLYPDQIQFPLVADALADEDGYVPLHVFVPVMEDISAGTGDQDVLLKLDWSTLTKTTEDDPNFEPEEPVEQSPAVDFTDSATGVKVHADKGVFDEGVQIVVSEITSGADYDSAVSSLSDVGKKFKLYDVKFLDADGNEVAPNGTVSISLPITTGYDSANLAVYRLADGGKVLVKGAVENGYYTVITKTAGTYALVEKGSTITDVENTENVDNGNQNQNDNTTSPQTGDTSNIAVYALLALAAAGMMGVTLVTRKRKSEES